MCAVLCLVTAAQDNDKILNRPYADLKRLHFGFSVGFHFQDLKLQNNGFITENGESWKHGLPRCRLTLRASV